MSSFNKTSSSSAPLYRAYQFFIALRAYLPGWAGGLRGKLSAADERLVTMVLPSPVQQRLFERMSPNDRRHGIAVARTLQQAGHHQPALLQAALLHDVAKCLGQPIIHRVLIVLLAALWPEGLAHLSACSFQNDEEFCRGEATQFEAAFANKGSSEWPRPYPDSFLSHANDLDHIGRWRRPFVVHAQHPALGAAWATKAGCQSLAVRLIARHQDTLNEESCTEEARLLAALQWADNLN